MATAQYTSILNGICCGYMAVNNRDSKINPKSWFLINFNKRGGSSLRVIEQKKYNTLLIFIFFQKKVKILHCF